MPAKPLDELAASVEALATYGVRNAKTRLTPHAENARELVRRVRSVEQVVAVYPLGEGGVVRRIRAALTGANEENKSDG
jgi:hypothetical protein